MTAIPASPAPAAAQDRPGAATADCSPGTPAGGFVEALAAALSLVPPVPAIGATQPPAAASVGVPAALDPATAGPASTAPAAEGPAPPALADRAASTPAAPLPAAPLPDGATAGSGTARGASAVPLASEPGPSLTSAGAPLTAPSDPGTGTAGSTTPAVPVATGGDPGADLTSPPTSGPGPAAPATALRTPGRSVPTAHAEAPTTSPAHGAGREPAPAGTTADPLPAAAASGPPIGRTEPALGSVLRPAAGDPAPSALVRQVLPAITRQAGAGHGTHRLTVALQPEHLGEVRVTLVVRDGSVQVSLAADAAKQALVHGAPELRRLLEQEGLGDARVVVRDLPQDPSSREGAGSQGQRETAWSQPQRSSADPDPGGRDPQRQEAPATPVARAAGPPGPGPSPTTVDPPGRLDRLM